MTRDQLYEYMRDPLLLSEKTLSELQTLADAYPYCSTFSFLYLFNLAIVDDVRYPSELRNRAPLLPDRRKLYRMVKAYRQAEVLSDVSAEKQPDSFELIDSFLGEMRAAGLICLMSWFIIPVETLPKIIFRKNSCPNNLFQPVHLNCRKKKKKNSDMKLNRIQTLRKRQKSMIWMRSFLPKPLPKFI